jgi:hypothetical protein
MKQLVDKRARLAGLFQFYKRSEKIKINVMYYDVVMLCALYMNVDNNTNAKTRF